MILNEGITFLSWIVIGVAIAIGFRIVEFIINLIRYVLQKI